MIRTENFEVNGRQFVRTYSDEGRYVIGGSPMGAYVEATDPAELNRTYVEGELMPVDEAISDEERALTRYINEQMSTNNSDLVSATETLITNYIKEA